MSAGSPSLAIGTAGCSSADIVGTWSIIDIDQDGTTIERPSTFDDIENGQPVSVFLSIRRIFEEGGEGAWQTYYAHTYDDGGTRDDPFDYDTASQRRGPRTFQVQSSSGIDLDTSCTLDEDMTCEGEKDGGPLPLRAEPHPPQ